ncbi:helix-turn-helix transcriptional regulator [Neorhizobium galegae]|uniref:helix-turn-helix transcriptional regulator n=1 Tax=Neorhizobium galegae TaxID=399 RepID=UPI00203553C3|nr:helix-turn-helix transcriptional regulator [Neorhizobium galegae]MCQ1779967.1 helix-turn-helix transcriptional regulator [Neorhizobium galegae]MCQ1794147.1 helix-turn-helix transcriptional regulator [Neorhizobium galegae]
MSVDFPEQLYEAAFIPELWPSVCETMARLAGAHSAAIATLDNDHQYRWVCSPRIHKALVDFSTSEIRYENIRPERHIQSRKFAFLRDIDLMTEKEIEEDPIYRERLRPLGFGWTAGDVLREPSGHLLIVDLLRETSAGPFQPDDMATMNRLKPDITRAAWLASRLAFKQARNTVETLELIGMPAAVIGDNGGVMEANPQFQGLGPQVLIGAGNRIRLSSASAELLLGTCITAVRNAEVPTVQSIPLPARTEEETPLIINVVPIKKRSRDIFNRSLAVLLVTKVGLSETLDPHVLQGLFDLTPGEARIAWEIGSGGTVDRAAENQAISRETVRTYLKRIMMKTGVRTQAQLVLLLRGLPFLR